MNIFNIGGHTLGLNFTHEQQNSIELLPSFSAFAVEGSNDMPLFTLSIDDTTRPAPGRKLLRKFDTGNGDTLVYMLPDGGYQFIIRDTAQNDCCLLIADSRFSNARCALNGDSQMRSFGLNNALMLCYAFAGSFYDTLLVHASCIMTDQGLAYPFIAASGTGKSTHTSLWLKHIEGCSLLNDDNPVIRIQGGRPVVYGSPWSGKTPCYRNRSAALGAVTRIERAPANSIERLGPVEAFASLLPACSTMKWDTTLHQNLCNTITRIIETTPVYTLHCLPDEEAALICHSTLTASNL
ncbi:MAG: hypothetical protein IJT98_08505 [Prevotella sp.]|nr:hypothetical protein [Prevotella sp.]